MDDLKARLVTYFSMPETTNPDSVYVPGGLAYWPTGNAVAIFHAPERDMTDVPIIHFGKIDEGEEIFAEYDGEITIERYDELETEE